MSFDKENRVELDIITQMLYKHANILGSQNEQEESTNVRYVANYISSILAVELPIEKLDLKFQKQNFEILITDEVISMSETTEYGHIVRYWKKR